MKLLCAADLHLGRRPSRLPDEFGGFDEADLATALTPQAAWRALVDLAVAQSVNAVLLAGDLLDDEHDFYGTFGDLQAGVERLVASGIEVLAVSGNHDVAVLPRLARAVPALRLLGAAGTWEVTTLRAGVTRVHVAGWSYPAATVVRSPLPGLAAAVEALEPAPIVGLLHCDRDQPNSRYLPVASSELAAAPVDVWLLGHVHKPDFGPPAAAPDARRLSGYLGSLSAADPGEEGPRGAWLLEFDAAGVSANHIPLAGLRYETLTVDVSAVGVAADLAPQVMAAVDEFVVEMIGRGPAGPMPTRALGLRLRLVGRSPIRAELAAHLQAADPRDSLVHRNGVVAFIHDVRLEALPAIDLANVALGRDPLALVARKLLLLADHGDPARASLLAAARRDLERAVSSKYYSELPAADLSDEAIAEHLRRAALTVIDAMMAA